MATSRPLKVLSLYEGFFVGGARIVHSAIIKQLHLQGQEHSVLSLTNRQYREYMLQRAEDNFLWKDLSEAGLKLTALDRDGSEPLTADEREQVARLLEAADVVLSLKEQPLEIIEEIPFTTPLVVALHRSDPEHQGSGPASLLRYQAADRLTRVVCVAHAAKTSYGAAGLAEEHIEVIANGIDLVRFARDEEARREVRTTLAIPQDAPVVMLSARFDEMKNVPLFLEAACTFQKLVPEAHFIMCGSGLQESNPAFQEALAEKFGECDRSKLHPIGVTTTIERYYSAADVIALTSSFGEAFPLCLIEAMACGAVPVATAVGDTELIVDGRGVIVEKTADAVAAGWLAVLEELPHYRAQVAVARPSLGDGTMVESYRILLESARRGLPESPLSYSMIESV
jgi:glycosyltransferase involved in cell wall biosynthesis